MLTRMLHEMRAAIANCVVRGHHFISYVSLTRLCRENPLPVATGTPK
jgi:hypothetical protein